MDYHDLKNVPLGSKIRAIRPPKYKNSYSSGPVFQTDDTYPEVRLVRPAQVIEGILSTRPLLRHGVPHPAKRVFCLITKTGQISCKSLSKFELL